MLITRDMILAIPELNESPLPGFFIAGHREYILSHVQQPLTPEEFGAIPLYGGYDIYPAIILLWFLYYANEPKILRNFACDCAERVLKRSCYTSGIDPIFILALEAARAYANDEMSSDELAQFKWPVRDNALRVVGGSAIWSACYKDDLSAALATSRSSVGGMILLAAIENPIKDLPVQVTETGQVWSIDTEFPGIQDIRNNTIEEEYRWQALQIGFCWDQLHVPSPTMWRQECEEVLYSEGWEK